MYSPGDGQTSCTVWLASGERRRCSNEGKTRNRLKFAGVPQTRQQISAVSRPKFTICEDVWRKYRCLTSFFPIVDICLTCEDIARQVVQWCADGEFWRFLSPVFSASRVLQHISDLHSKFALRHISLRSLRLGDEKRKKKTERIR